MKRVTETLLVLLLIPGFGWAKSAQNNWENLKELHPGQKIQVVDSTLKTLNGSFVSVSDEALSLQVGKSEESVPRAKIVRVSVRDNSHRARNMLLASGVLGGIAVAATAVPLIAGSNEGNSCPVCVAVIVAGFGGGAAAGAIPGSRTVFRANK